VDFFLSVPGVADVDVFGGHQPEVVVEVDRDALAARGLSLPDLLARLAEQNVTRPAGTVYGSSAEYLVKVTGEFPSAGALTDLPVASTTDGRQVKLGDVARIKLGAADLRSFYHGNGKPAIALNLLRAEGGNTVEAIRNAKQALGALEQRFPDLEIEITDDQQPIIDINVHGMRTSLWQAVALTVVVIFLFLADLRAAAVVSVSIPLSFLAALVVLWFSPHTLNMVTLSGLIIAAGMVVDASVVVVENIHRHYSRMSKPNAVRAALAGTGEVSLPITAGVFTTVVVLVPVMFTRGFTSRIMEPLNLMVIVTLLASLVVALSVVPLLASRWLNRPHAQRNRLERLALPVSRVIDRITEEYLRLVGTGLRHRWLFALVMVAFVVLTMRVVKPLLGVAQMPRMDTGIAIVEFDTEASATPREVESTLSRVEEMIYQTPGVERVSAAAGSEPGAISFGSGGATTQSARITVHLVDRTRRKETIWDIEQAWRDRLREIPGVRTFRVSEYGATPISTTKAPFNLILSGPDVQVLDRLADRVIQRLRGTPGMVDLRRSWHLDKDEIRVTADPALTRLYGTSPEQVAENLQAAVQGVPVTQLRLQDFLSIPIRVRYSSDQVADPSRLAEAMIPTRLGMTPLRALATIEKRRTLPSVTREDLKPTIDITAVNTELTIGQVTGLALERLRGVEMPADYELAVAGTVRDNAESQAELGRALIIGIVLLYLILVAMFQSFRQPVTVMSAIPLAVSGALWGLLLFDKPFCQPAFMGIILLGGTIVNNAILLLDFIIEARRKGMGKDEAILESVRLRLRPILMTATSTLVGLSPLIFERAVGLERMSPLGIAAGTGLLLGTVITTVAIPVIYSLFESAAENVGRLFEHSGVKATAGLLIGPLAVGMAWPAPAPQLPDPLTLPAAIRYALEHHPDLSAARARIKRFESQASVAASQLRPHVDLIASETSSKERHTVVPGLGVGGQRLDHWVFQSGAVVRALLWDFGETSARVKSARLRKNASELQEERLRQELAFDVARYFLSALAVEDLLEAARSSRNTLNSILGTTEQLLSQGRAARVDVLKVKVQLAQVESRIEGLQAQRSSLRAGLAEAIGWPGEASLPPLAYRDPDSSIAEAPVETEAAVLQRPDLAALSQEVAAGREEVAAAGKARWPRFELEASYLLYGAPDPLAMLPGGATVDSAWKDDAVAGVRVTFPLWDGGLRESRKREAQAGLQEAEARLQSRRLAALRELEQARAEWRGAWARVRATESSVTEAQEALRVEKLRYSAGKGVINDVLAAEAALLEARAQLREARRQVEIARLAVDLAEGRTPMVLELQP
ncbi:MAG TPA: efflux RND transporter permease subunit, partial [Acidobacteriota bacterium]|nr:efflux RND transporter permease subunit [Acidobacteriota bacterium]